MYTVICGSILEIARANGMDSINLGRIESCMLAVCQDFHIFNACVISFIMSKWDEYSACFFQCLG